MNVHAVKSCRCRWLGLALRLSPIAKSLMPLGMKVNLVILIAVCSPNVGIPIVSAACKLSSSVQREYGLLVIMIIVELGMTCEGEYCHITNPDVGIRVIRSGVLLPPILQ